MINPVEQYVLDHKVLDDSVEVGALVPESEILAFSGLNVALADHAGKVM